MLLVPFNNQMISLVIKHLLVPYVIPVFKETLLVRSGKKITVDS